MSRGSQRRVRGRAITPARAVALLAAAMVLALACRNGKEAPAPGPPPLVIAHRGASSLAPENTLAAARTALALGAGMWEFDVRLTADGEPILMHDSSLERTCDAPAMFPARRPWAVRDFTIAELRQLDCGSWYADKDPFQQIAAGAVSAAEADSYRGEPAPTLREALSFTRAHGWRADIELKSELSEERSRTLVEKTVALVSELDMDDGHQVIISSSRHDYLAIVRTMNSAIPAMALLTRPVEDLPGYLAQTGATMCGAGLGGWDAGDIREALRQDLTVYVWTVNAAADMNELLPLGVHGVITDYPQTLIGLLPAE